MPAGNINITKYWSWHPGPLPTYNEANQQWAIKVGAAVTGFTEDLVGTNTTALTIGALGVFASPGGTISLVHSSTPGGGYPGVYDGSGNSVVPLGFCYQVVPTVESTIASTIAPTTAAPTTAAPTTASTATTKPGDVTVAPTVAPTTKLPATTQPAPGVLVATPGVTLGANPLSPPTPAPTPAPNPAPTTAAPIATTVPATTVPVTTTPATTLAPTTAAPTVAPATAVIAPEVLGEQIEQTTVAYTGTESRSTAFVGFGLTLTGLSLMLATRKRRA
jgi:LPXTG-motif cell wall-anchored protein